MGSDTSKENLKVSFNQVNLEWKVKKFSSQPTGTDLDSPIFLINGEEWFFKMRQKEKSGSKYIGLYLIRKCTLPEDIHVVFTIGIKHVDGSIYVSSIFDHKFNVEDNECGSELVQRDKLLLSADKVILDDSLSIFCKAHLVDKSMAEVTTQTLTTERIHTLAQNLMDLFLSGSHSDVIFKVGDVTFPAHRSVLAARSQVFRSMFELEMNEKKKGVANIVDCNPRIFKDFLIFLYSGTVTHVTAANAPGLYEVADKYDMKELKEECVQCLSRDLSPKSFFDTVLIAKNYDELELLKVATKFFSRNLNAIFKSKKWVKFMSESTDLANELLLQSQSPNSDK